jgi:hypothetical protein
MKGEAPLGNKPLYTASRAFLMREDSTKRSRVELRLFLRINMVEEKSHARLINKRKTNFFAW